MRNIKNTATETNCTIHHIAFVILIFPSINPYIEICTCIHLLRICYFCMSYVKKIFAMVLYLWYKISI